MKIWAILLKDVLLRLRDTRALFLGLITPLILTAVIGASFGDVMRGAINPLPDIPAVVVNQDTGPLGEQMVNVLHQLGPQGVQWSAEQDLQAALAQVEQGRVVAVVNIPAGFSRSALEQSAGQVELYTDPVRQISAGVVERLVARVTAGINHSVITTQTARQMASQAAGGALDPAAFEAALTAALLETANGSEGQLRLESTYTGAASPVDNPLAYLAVSLAAFFLLFGLFDTIQSFLSEVKDGTLARLVSTGTGVTQVLLGKIGAVFLVGALQLALLIAATRLIFQLSWGSSLAGLGIMVAAVAAAVTSLGAFLSTFARDANRANVIAGFVVLLSASIGGSFIPPYGFPQWLQTASYITVTRWAIDGMVDLVIRNLGIGEILLEAGVLMGMAVVFLALSVWRFPHFLKR